MSFNVAQVDGGAFAQDLLEQKFDEWIVRKRRRQEAAAYGLFVISMLCCCSQWFSRNTYTLLPGAVIVGINSYALWLVLFDSEGYMKKRTAIFKCLWYTLSVLLISTHSTLEFALHESSGRLSKLMMLLSLKLLPLTTMTLTFSMKTQLVSSVQFLALLLFHVGSLSAALEFAEPIQQSELVQQVAAFVNGYIMGVVGRCAWPLSAWTGDRIPLAVPATSQEFFSPLQCMLLVWILLQATAFWAMFVANDCQEMRNRRAFLQSAGMTHVEVRSCFGDVAVGMLVVHLYFALFLMLCISTA